jgi:hypothetical protein
VGWRGARSELAPRASCEAVWGMPCGRPFHQPVLPLFQLWGRGRRLDMATTTFTCGMAAW